MHRYLPHEKILPSASLVIGHGGHSTTMRALAHDIPLLILPMHPVLDQSMIGNALVAAGAGRVLARTAPPAQIREAVLALLDEGPHQSAARTIGSRLRTTNGAVGAAEEVQGLLNPQTRTAGSIEGRLRRP
jgi:UDP:flavonoid glycosyltransferase YjiC (YdhE family)